MCLRMAPDANEAEIGFALAPHLWGTGVFQSAAEVYIDTLFARWPIARLIGRTLARNHRGLGAMRKLGATIVEHTQREDETEFVWAIKRDVWQRASKPSGPQAPKPSGA
jgi:RimJ/RimL family protein N-acetyltransferase